MPLFVWSVFATAIMVLVATPALAGGAGALLLARTFGVPFFTPSKGGNVILWQHMFWFYSHPAVYIMMIPGFGVVSEVIAVFSRKPIFGYKAVAFSSFAIAFLSMLVWAHHMFSAGIEAWTQVYFMLATMVIAVPTGIKIFSWIATMWGGSLTFPAPMLFAIGFIFLFTVGGVTGVKLANASVDVVLHNTYYVVAHFHYVLSLGAVFGIFAGFYYWIGKMSGRQYPERLAQIHFWMLFIGVNLVFFPQHFLGANGMPRRYPDYPEAFWGWNLVSSIGAYIGGLSFLVFLYVVFRTLTAGQPAAANPWGEGATTLEWQVSSPPPFHTFEDLPRVR
jgi:cytochrome c oxidase subunit 1